MRGQRTRRGPGDDKERRGRPSNLEPRATHRPTGHSRLSKAEVARQRLSLILEETTDFVGMADRHGRTLYLNRSGRRLLGFGEEEDISAMSVPEFHPAWGNELLLTEAIPAVLEKGVWSGENALLHRDGHEIPISQVILAHRASNGQMLFMSTIARDITRSKQAEEEIRSQKEVLQTIFDNIPVLLCLFDPSGPSILVNPELERVLGWSLPDLLDRDIMADLYPDPMDRKTIESFLDEASGRWKEFRVQTRGGDLLDIQWLNVRLSDGRLLYIGQDITERKRVEQQLLHDAFHDTLTGLPNRALFLDRLGHALHRSRRREGPALAVLLLDLDRFKNINDSLGHLAGDELLQQASERLTRCVRPGDTVARFGGDEFTLLFEDLEAEEDATSLASRILEDLSQPFHIRGHEVFTSASIGIAFFRGGESVPEDLLREADTAMYGAKAEGKARYQIFGAAMHAKAVARLHLETDLRRALERRELRLVFQPIVELPSRRLAGFEALLRWRHPQRGEVLPGDFIPEAEENGLIVPIGKWVLEETCRWGSLLRQRFPGGRPWLSVNISARQFHREDFVDSVDRILAETDFPSRSLHLEITERVLIDQSETTLENLRRLRELGVRVEIDDFGSGYSSLSYLRRLPLDALKIDRSFVADLGRAAGGPEIVRAILTLGSSLGLEVIAEGIETDEQSEWLAAMDCKYGQGYLFSRPVDAEAATAWMKED